MLHLLELLTNSKSFQLIPLIPLITFVMCNVSISIILVYTAFFAIFSSYTYFIIPDIIKDKGTLTKKLLKPEYTKQGFFYQINKNLGWIPLYKVMIISTLIIICGFSYSFYISFVHLRENIYIFILALTHLYLIISMTFSTAVYIKYDLPGV